MGDTTELIHRRLRHWRTTAAGVAQILCPVIALFLPPEWSIKVLSIAAVLGGVGSIAAADAHNLKPK